MSMSFSGLLLPIFFISSTALMAHSFSAMVHLLLLIVAAARSLYFLILTWLGSA
jgi:hypothetical protein